MQNTQKIKLLEEALLSYVVKYGFTPEARQYFVRSYQSEVADCSRGVGEH